MKPTRRRFIGTTGLAGLGAMSAPSALASDSDARPNKDSDPTVTQVTGPFGEGLSLTMAGYDYNRVKPIVAGRVPVEGCAVTYEVTSIGPLNNHAFFGPQTRHVTEIGLIP